MNEIRLEPDAIHLQDENSGDNGWAAVVNLYCADDTPGNLFIARERFADEAAARRHADNLAAALTAKYARVLQPPAPDYRRARGVLAEE